MDLSVSDLKKDIRILGQLLKEKNCSLFRIKPKKYSHKIECFREKFRQYHETTILKFKLSKLYNFTGRFKFYGDNMLFIYLEVEDKKFEDGIRLSTALIWPVMCKWKVEMIDESDENNKEKAFILGEASCILNKPRQGFKSHPNVWISIDLASIENSGLISQDGSVILRWTVLTEPFLHGVNLEKFPELLEKLEQFCDSYVEPTTLIGRINRSADDVLEKRRDNKEKISVLEIEASQLRMKLKGIEKEHAEYTRSFKEFKDQNIVPLLLNHRSSSSPRGNVSSEKK